MNAVRLVQDAELGTRVEGANSDFMGWRCHVLRLRMTTPGAARFRDRLGLYRYTDNCTDPKATYWLNLR